MNNCLCESCCDKDYCLNYQDYKNPDGIITEPITACGQYSKLHTVEDIYTKDEVIAMFEELQMKIKEIADEEKLYDAKWALGLYFSKKIIQEYINAFRGEENGKDN